MLYILQQDQFVGHEDIMYLRTQKQYEFFFFWHILSQTSFGNCES